MDSRILSNFKVLCSCGDLIVSYHKGFLYVQSSFDEVPRKLIRINNPKKYRFLVKFRFTERVFRLEPRVAVELDAEQILLSYHGTIFRVNCQTGKVIEDHKYRKGMNNPLSFCVNGNSIIYGEYFGNRAKEPVSIFKRVGDGEWAKLYTFSAASINHIHQIIFDKYRDCYWILTGDSDEESGIWFADKDFNTVKPLIKGKQQYRSCFLVPCPEGLLFNTDTPLEKNGLYYIAYKGNDNWDKPKLINELPGPCIYGRIINDNMIVFATSVEPDSSLSSWRYQFSYKLGFGVSDRYSHIFLGNSKKGFREIYIGRKDILPMVLCQFGNFQFPNTKYNSSIIATGQSVIGYDGKTLEILLDPIDCME